MIKCTVDAFYLVDKEAKIIRRNFVPSDRMKVGLVPATRMTLRRC